MYLNFYKLREFPFSLTCEERFFYESPVHAEALANMMYCIQQRKGMVLVTGEVGTGESFIGNILGSRLGAGWQIVTLQNPPETKKQLLRGFAQQVGISADSTSDKMSLEDELREYLIRLNRRGRLVGLILDEAQELTNASLKEVRLLWNWENEGQRLIQILLIGQPELRERLQEPQWEPFKQRIVLSYHLKGLSAEDTSAYVCHRIRVASNDGAGVEFSGEALDAIHAATDGTPRLINILCDNALLVGYVNNKTRIDKPVIDEVLRNMTCWGLRVETPAFAK